MDFPGGLGNTSRSYIEGMAAASTAGVPAAEGKEEGGLGALGVPGLQPRGAGALPALGLVADSAGG